ncbi:MAG: hypothetical protein ACOX7D_01355, partial [Alphaproteobacteria bacterium]
EQKLIDQIKSRSNNLYYTINKKQWYYDLLNLSNCITDIYMLYDMKDRDFPPELIFELSIDEYEKLPNKYKGLFKCNKNRLYYPRIPLNNEFRITIKKNERQNFKNLLNDLHYYRFEDFRTLNHAINVMDYMYDKLFKISKIATIENPKSERNGNLIELLKDYAKYEKASEEAFKQANAELKNVGKKKKKYDKDLQEKYITGSANLYKKQMEDLQEFNKKQEKDLQEFKKKQEKELKKFEQEYNDLQIRDVRYELEARDHVINQVKNREKSY